MLARALLSVDNQTQKPAEIIVVDDAGGDDTCAQILLDFSHLPIRLVILPQNIGPGGARNAGIAAGSQDYVGFLDADDEWHPEKIERQMRLMLAYDGPALTAHNKSFSSEVWPAAVSDETLEFTRIGTLLRNPASISTVVIRRDVIRFLFPQWHAGEDYAFVAANILSGVTSRKLTAVLARAHKPAFGDSGLSAKMFDMQIGEMRSHRFLSTNGLIVKPLYWVLIVWTVFKFGRRLVLQQLRQKRLRYASTR